MHWSGDLVLLILTDTTISDTQATGPDRHEGRGSPDSHADTDFVHTSTTVELIAAIETSLSATLAFLPLLQPATETCCSTFVLGQVTGSDAGPTKQFVFSNSQPHGTQAARTGLKPRSTVSEDYAESSTNDSRIHIVRCQLEQCTEHNYDRLRSHSMRQASKDEHGFVPILTKRSSSCSLCSDCARNIISFESWARVLCLSRICNTANSHNQGRCTHVCRTGYLVSHNWQEI